MEKFQYLAVIFVVFGMISFMQISQSDGQSETVDQVLNLIANSILCMFIFCLTLKLYIYTYIYIEYYIIYIYIYIYIFLGPGEHLCTEECAKFLGIGNGICLKSKPVNDLLGFCL